MLYLIMECLAWCFGHHVLAFLDAIRQAAEEALRLVGSMFFVLVVVLFLLTRRRR